MTFQEAIEISLVKSLEKGYPAPLFRRMWKADPSMYMLENMMRAPDIQTGLHKLAELRLLRYSVEQVVIDYSTNREAIQAAQWRLRMVKALKRK